ncbi:hypothetical protein FHR99_003218 [Litorivivens lipolytica]|uniref:Uncharacterized protein n=1 Tax=Litorivivens lipolytica TaxID=1524264 RepID=A0A7W4W8R5_9GAMM|nr:hypothetical protein [Litorivivens lipolytica]MBB3048944.1 hypothetical protein [Litorivivens lipolytica]
MSKELYHYRKSRAQWAFLFLNMAIACWVYIGAIFAAERFFAVDIPADTRFWAVLGFSIASVLLLAFVYWLLTHPAVYEAIITEERFVVSYPDSEAWSFDVSIADIKRFEHRRKLSHAGDGITYSGILMKNGTFHNVSMNYGNNINKMFKAIKTIRPELEFPSQINQKVEGPLARDYKP